MKKYYDIALTTLLLFLLVGCSSAKEVELPEKGNQTQSESDSQADETTDKEDNEESESQTEEQDGVEPFVFPENLPEQLGKANEQLDLQVFRNETEAVDWTEYEDYLRDERTFTADDLNEPLQVSVEGANRRSLQAIYLDGKLLVITVDSNSLDENAPNTSGLDGYLEDLSQLEAGRHLLQLVQFKGTNSSYEASILGEKYFTIE